MYKSGYTVLLLTIIVSVIGTALAISSLSTSTQVGKNAINITESELNLSQARSCTDKVLSKLRAYTFYTGDETLMPEECRVLGITGTGNTSRVIHVQKGNKILETKVSQINPTMIIEYQKPIDYTLNNGDTQARNFNQNNPYLVANTNLTLWMKADLAQTNAGFPVSSINDVSNTNTPFTQSNTNFTPRLNMVSLSSINTTPRPVLTFDGIDDFLSGPIIPLHNTTGLSVFIVGKTNTITPNQTFIGKFDPIESQREWRLQNTAFQVAETGSVDNNPNEQASIPITTNSQIITGIWTPTSPVQAFINNGTSTTSITNINDITVADGTESVLIGAHQFPNPTNFLNGDIAEIIIFNTALTTPQRTSILQYLNTKYAIY